MKRHNWTAWLALLMLKAPCPAFGGPGTDSFQFLNLDAGSRASALGGAYTALARDANALRYNPAGLAEVRSHEITFMHHRYLETINQEYLAYASPWGWGLALNYLDFGGVGRTTVSNPDGNGLGQASLVDLALGGGVGYQVASGLSLGGGFKYVQEATGGYTATATALDAGVLYHPPGHPQWSLATAVQNAGPKARFQTRYESLPLVLRGGTAYEFKLRGSSSLATLDVIKPRNQAPHIAVGTETRLGSSFAVRMGYNSNLDAGLGLTVGFGVSRGMFSVDYAFVPIEDLGNSHRFSMTTRW